MVIKNITIELHHEPISKKRHRDSCGKKYDPQSKLKYAIKQDIKKKAMMRNYSFKKNNTYSVAITSYHKMPDSWSKKKKENFDGCLKNTKPDCDNVIKFYLDCMNGIIYHDDAQVASVQNRKFWSQEQKVVIQILPEDRE